MVGFQGFGRTFDFAMRACEKSQPLLLPLLKKSSLFCFPHKEDFLKGMKGYTKTPEQKDFWMQNFALPYSVTAIEDQLGLSLLWDADCLDDLRDDANNIEQVLLSEGSNPASAMHPMYVSTYPRQGLDCWRFFASFRGSWSYTEEERRRSLPDGNPTWMVNPNADHLYIAFGAVKLDRHTDTSPGFLSRSAPIATWCLSKTAKWFGCDPANAWSEREAKEHAEIIRACAPQIANEAHRALEEVMWFNDPDRFVVEEKQEGEKKGRSKKWGKGKRSSERPTYHSCTALDIKKMRGSSGESTGEGPSPRGHQRRGHFRTLRADRYARSGMKDKTILVRPCFVGDENFTVDRHHYRVLMGENDVLVGEQQKRESA